MDRCCCLLKLLLAMTSVCAVIGQSERPDVSQYAPDPKTFHGLDVPTNKTIDQLITDALGGIDVASNKILAPGAYVLAELDMYLTQDQFLAMYDPPKTQVERGPPNSKSFLTSSRQKRKAVSDVILRWPGGEVAYQIPKGHFSDQEEYVLRQAMTEWERYTCVRFRPAVNTDTNVLRIQNGEGCNSQLGMVGGVQLLNLDVSGCRFKGLYLHEIGHALGLVHEHQLPDRDLYIDILLHHVAPHFRVFFNKYSPRVVNQFNVPYQYSSVMHYGIQAFSYNGNAQTIRTKDPTKEKEIGRIYLKELAFSDVKVVNEMYSCNAPCPSEVRCEGDGYVDQNCKCVCPDGTGDCQVKVNDDKVKDTDKGMSGETCENMYENWKCSVWANQGECERNARYMEKFCRKACHLCDNKKLQDTKNHFTTWAWQWFGMFTNIFPKEWMVGVCKDVYPYGKCYKWKKQGDCVTNKQWMEDNCKMTCNFCGNPALRPETGCKNILDDAKCDKWALDGECILNTVWMNKKCRRSCRTCADTLLPDGQGDEGKEEKEDCSDKHNSLQCAAWAGSGECSKNPSWMLPNCKRSCNKCSDGVCKNLYGDHQCGVWAQDMECLSNRQWMHTNCARACGVCVDNGSHPDLDPDLDPGKVTTSTTTTTRRPHVTRRTTRRPRTTARTTRRSERWTTRQPVYRTTRQPDTGSCKNTHNDMECGLWADSGHCDINPEWMYAHCTKACNQCQHVGRDEEECRDQDKGCPGWAEHGFCDSNPRYNLIHCKKSCNNCNGCRDEQFLCQVWAKAGHCQSNSGFMLRSCQRSCDICQ